MDFMLTIVSEKNSPTLSVKMDSDAATLFAIRLMDIFADEVKFENGLVVKGRTYQQKTPELILKLREFIQNNGNQQVLWQFYGVLSGLADGEYFAVITQNINEDILKIIRNELLHMNHPDYDDLLKFEADFCQGIIDNYDMAHYGNERQQVKIGEPDKSKRRCRFCGKMMPDVSYGKVAHTISEALGNKSIITNDECDKCNEDLGKEVEQDLIVYLSPLRTFMSVTGKNGKVKIKDDSFAFYEDGPRQLKIDLFDKDDPEMKHWNVERDGDNFKVTFTHPQMVNTQDVYRAVAKYAIGIMDDAQLPHFQDTIRWIKKEISATDLPRLCFFLDQNPGKEGKPCVTVFFRKNDDRSLPYSYVELQMSGVVIFAILPFCDQDDRTFSKKEDWKHTMDVLKIYNKMPFLKGIIPNKDEAERITYNFDFKKRTDVDE